MATIDTANTRSPGNDGDPSKKRKKVTPDEKRYPLGDNDDSGDDDESVEEKEGGVNSKATSKATDLWRILVEDWGFPEDLARTCDSNGTAKSLIELESSGFVISEGDPLLLVVVDMNNPASVGYANAGNYGIPAGTPGYLAWPGGVAPVAGAALPIPNGVAQAPPNALASCLRGMPAVEDKSGGNGLLFFLPSMTRLHDMPSLLQAHPQFRRIGPIFAAAVAAAAGVGGPPPPGEDPLVQFYTLDRMRGAPGGYSKFNTTV